MKKLEMTLAVTALMGLTTACNEYIDDLRQFVNNHIPYLQQAFETRRQTAAVPYSIRRAETDDPALYDLQGRRTKNPTGVYIKNHKKFIP